MLYSTVKFYLTSLSMNNLLPAFQDLNGGDGTNLLNDANHCLTYWEDFSVKHDAISISNLGGGGENEAFSYLEGKKKSANYVESFERHPKSL